MALLTAPKFVKSLPPAQRAALAPRRSQLEADVAKFVDQLKDHRDEFALAAEKVTATSSIYETFRKAGCEVRVVRKVNPDGSPMVERKTNRKNEGQDYPVCDIYVMLPAGEIVNRSGRKPWIPPTQRLETARTALKNSPTAEKRKELEAEIAGILERNPKLKS